MPHPDADRFLTIPQVAEELATSTAQITALVKRGELVAIKIGGRGQWRIERSKLEEYIARCYEDTEQQLREKGRLDVGRDNDQEGPAGEL